jgi:hypothetical protein
MSADNWGTCPSCHDENSLREDYELYINPDTGEFRADYSGGCSLCGFKFTFHHREITIKGERFYGCPKCRIEKDESESYCSKCGTKLLTFSI